MNTYILNSIFFLTAAPETQSRFCMLRVSCKIILSLNMFIYMLNAMCIGVQSCTHMPQWFRIWDELRLLGDHVYGQIWTIIYKGSHQPSNQYLRHILDIMEQNRGTSVVVSGRNVSGDSQRSFSFRKWMHHLAVMGPAANESSSLWH